MFGDPVANPMGWEIVDLETICTKITDGEHITPRRSSEGVYLLSARNILNHIIDVSDVDYIDEGEYTRISKRILPKKGDILISCSGSIGRVARISDNMHYQMVRSVAILQLANTVNPIFVEYCFDTEYLQGQILRASNQSSQANLFQGKIQKLKIILPSISLQTRFADFVQQVDKTKICLSLYLDCM